MGRSGLAPVLQLRVNDTRFDTDDTLTIHFFPMIDSDGDGLSDQEEITGLNNVLTTANPNGATSNQNVADSDGDGMNDGDEALAGTNPNSAASLFRITTITKNAQGVNVTWSSVAGKTYQLQRSQNFVDWDDVGDPQTANSSTTSAPDSAPPAPPTVYRVVVVS